MQFRIDCQYKLFQSLARHLQQGRAEKPGDLGSSHSHEVAQVLRGDVDVLVSVVFFVLVIG